MLLASRLVGVPQVVINNKRGGGFKKAKGKGSVVLKCEARLPSAVFGYDRTKWKKMHATQKDSTLL
jgi:hypothetical protein